MQRVPSTLVLHEQWGHTIEYTSDKLKIHSKFNT